MKRLPTRRVMLAAAITTVIGRGAVWAQESNRTFRLGMLVGVPRQAPQWVAFFDELDKAGLCRRQESDRRLPRSGVP